MSKEYNLEIKSYIDIDLILQITITEKNKKKHFFSYSAENTLIILNELRFLPKLLIDVLPLEDITEVIIMCVFEIHRLEDKIILNNLRLPFLPLG
jgi:hypothetical protein